ncbi:MAG: adenosylcobinamide-phosphate synthase CbiB [Phormidesmis sp.]
MLAAGRRPRAKGQALWFDAEPATLLQPFLQSSLLLAAAGLDFALGDPWGWPHPVQAMGKAISFYSQRVLALPLSPAAMKLAGVGLACGLIGAVGLLSWIGISAVGRVSVPLQWGVQVVLLASCFAGRSLRRAAEDVLEALSDNSLAKNKDQGNLQQARDRLARYVGRDTQQLSASEIRRALLETVSENAVDGVLAPLFYAIVGAWVGAAVPVALAYKAASTLDSMVGYREAPYTDLGWFSARCEDALTWVPCRLSVGMVALLSGQPKTVLSLCRRDAIADPSPNAGWSECAYAAALGVQLGGPNTYRGQLKIKPLLAEARRPITADVIWEALRMTRRCFLIGLLLGIISLWLSLGL